MPRKRRSSDPDRARARMYSYWDRVFSEDEDSQTARALIERTADPQSLFHDEEFLNRFVDDMEREKKVKSTRHIVKE